jgi:DNA-binding SARP family transcriptional activator
VGIAPRAQARQNLRQGLYILRQVLGEDSIVSHGHSVSLDARVVACDVPRFEALIREGTRDALAAATELHKGPFLADLDIAEDAWASG